MLVLGSLLALLSGMFNAAAAALEKREGLLAETAHGGFRLLAVLARRPLWLLAIGFSAVGWVCEAASLATAPVPVVATLRNAGRGMLVVGGARWLNERYSRLELVGVALASAGAIVTAVGAAHTAVVRSPLSNLTELVVAAVCVAGAAAVVRLASWWAGGEGAAKAGPNAGSPSRLERQLQHRRRRDKAAGVATGAAVGLLFAGTGVFTKEIGDRFALYGVSGLTGVLESGGPWLMIAMSVWSQSLIQQAFRRANAATVSAAIASVSSLGLIGAGFILYKEALPRGLDAWLLLVGMGVALVGTALLIGSRPGEQAGPGHEDGTGGVPAEGLSGVPSPG